MSCFTLKPSMHHHTSCQHILKYYPQLDQVSNDKLGQWRSHTTMSPIATAFWASLYAMRSTQPTIRRPQAGQWLQPICI